MSNHTDPNAPAFPAQFFDERATGLSVRQYAAIQLKVPSSGTDWLDDMIRKSLRDDFAAKAMPMALKHVQEIVDEETGQPFGFDFKGFGDISGDCDMTAEYAYELADAMLQARKGS